MTHKLIACGDTHGRSAWKDIISQEEDATKIVLIGDYFDSFDIPGDIQIKNYQDIIAYKRANPDKVVLLIGNHDYHYMEGVNEHYSGFQSWYQYMIQMLLKDTIDCLQMCYLDNGYLFTHAGVSETWSKMHGIDITPQGIEAGINNEFKQRPDSFRFMGRDNYGDDITQSPIWIRPNSLKKDRIPGYIQVVGHTPYKRITLDEQIYFIDVLDRALEYLVIQDGKAETKLLTV